MPDHQQIAHKLTSRQLAKQVPLRENEVARIMVAWYLVDEKAVEPNPDWHYLCHIIAAEALSQEQQQVQPDQPSPFSRALHN